LGVKGLVALAAFMERKALDPSLGLRVLLKIGITLLVTLGGMADLYGLNAY
jgi:hypothetical protein